MSERNEAPRAESGTEHAPIDQKLPPDWSQAEAPEIKGWALRWDAAALSKASLAKRMRELREASGNP